MLWIYICTIYQRDHKQSKGQWSAHICFPIQQSAGHIVYGMQPQDRQMNDTVQEK